MRQWTIDAFAIRPFTGNQACVVEPLPDWPTASWMQALARENEVGATAFMTHPGPSGRIAIRWFTPFVEVPLCGHATLAAAHAMFQEIGLPGSGVEFDTASGPLSVRRAGERLEMDLPAQPAKRIDPPAALSRALGVSVSEVWAGPYLIAVLESEDAVRSVSPDHRALREVSLGLGGQGNVGIAALTDGAGAFDVVDRFFAPGYGIDEDAATGSFHCILTPILAPRLGASPIRFQQASPGRGAEITGALDGDRVLLSGGAVTVIESRLRFMPGDPSGGEE